jgi:hypothetical protein
MCRNIKTLHNFKPPATDEEIRATVLSERLYFAFILRLPQGIRQLRVASGRYSSRFCIPPAPFEYL